jgi:Cupin superfamily protein
MSTSSIATSPPPSNRRYQRLAKLVHPISPETFEREYYQQRPLVVQRDDPRYYAHLLTLADMDGILATMAVPDSSIRLVNRGTATRLSDLSTAGGAAEAIYREYRKGATVNVMFLHDRWPPLGRLCRVLAAQFTATVQTNVYLTPRHSQGLNPHYDTHDVFVAQIHGSKHWRLYDSAVRLPLTEHRPVAPEGGFGAPVREFDMRPGDLLYLPRGTAHDATSNDEASLHLTIGVAPLTWAGFLELALRDAAARDVRLREAVPRDPGELRDTVTRLLAGISGQVDEISLLNQARQALADGGAAELSGHLLDLEAVPGLDLDTPLFPRTGLSASLSITDGAACLEFHRKSIRMPARVAEELRFVTERPGFTGREIPGPLDESGRLVLLRTLLREGVLTHHAPADA